MPKINKKYQNFKDWASDNITKENVKAHLADSAAVTTILTPMASFIDTYFAGMTDLSAIKSRLLVTGLTFGGLGSLISRSGDIYRRSFGIESESKKDNFRWDAVRLSVVSAIASVPLYLMFGVNSLYAGLAGMGITAVSHPIALGTTNLFRNVAGLKTSYPLSFLKDIKPKTRKGLVGLMVATSIASTTAVYNFNSDTDSLQPIKQEIHENSQIKKSLNNYLIK